MDMVERVARAICLANGNDPDGGGFGNAGWREYLTESRAAIEAMSEVTGPMGLAGYAAWDNFGQDALLGPVELIAIWRAMVTAALEGRPDG